MRSEGDWTAGRSDMQGHQLFRDKTQAVLLCYLQILYARFACQVMPVADRKACKGSGGVSSLPLDWCDW